MVNINRYTDLINTVPSGWDYDPSGILLPYQEAPHEFRFETSPIAPNQRFGLYINNVFKGIVVTDSNGIVIVSVTLNPGRYTIHLENDFDATKLKIFVDVRSTATIHASYAEALEQIDQNIDVVDDG